MNDSDNEILKDIFKKELKEFEQKLPAKSRRPISTANKKKDNESTRISSAQSRPKSNHRPYSKHSKKAIEDEY